MFSGTYPGRPPTPPRDSSEGRHVAFVLGCVGQAGPALDYQFHQISLWISSNFVRLDILPHQPFGAALFTGRFAASRLGESAYIDALPFDPSPANFGNTAYLLLRTLLRQSRE